MPKLFLAIALLAWISGFPAVAMAGAFCAGLALVMSRIAQDSAATDTPEQPQETIGAILSQVVSSEPVAVGGAPLTPLPLGASAVSHVAVAAAAVTAATPQTESSQSQAALENAQPMQTGETPAVTVVPVAQVALAAGMLDNFVGQTVSGASSTSFGSNPEVTTSAMAVAAPAMALSSCGLDDGWASEPPGGF